MSEKRNRETRKIDARRERMLQQVSEDGPSNLAVFRKAYGSVALRAAVNAFCLECVWLDRGAIRECTSTACPLWNVRPYQVKRVKNGRRRLEADGRQTCFHENDPTADTSNATGLSLRDPAEVKPLGTEGVMA